MEAGRGGKGEEVGYREKYRTRKVQRDKNNFFFPPLSITSPSPSPIHSRDAGVARVVAVASLAVGQEGLVEIGRACERSIQRWVVN